MASHSKADQLYADELVGYWIDLSRYEGSLQREMTTMYDDLSHDLRRLLDEANRQPGKLSKIKRARLETLLKASSKTIESRVGTLEIEKPETIKELLLDGNEVGVHSMNHAIGANVLVATMTPNQAEALAQNFIVQGEQFNKLWRKEWDYLKDDYAKIVRIHTSYGEGIDQITRSLFDLPELIENLKGEVSPRWEGRALMAKVRSRATTLASTSVMTASNEGLKNLYEANDDLFVGYEHLSTLDKRTSATCRGRDGKRWDMQNNPIGSHDKVFRWPPLHPWCRSILQTLLKTWEEMKGAQVLVDPETGRKRSFQRLVGQKRNAVSRQLRRSEDGLVSKGMDYEKFLRRKGDDYARDVMGPGRFKLWKDGLIRQVDLTDAYGNELNLVQLRKLAASRRRRR